MVQSGYAHPQSAFLGISPKCVRLFYDITLKKSRPLGTEVANWRAFQLKIGTCKIPQMQLSAHNLLSQVATACLWMGLFQGNCEHFLKEIL